MVTAAVHDRHMGSILADRIVVQVLHAHPIGTAVLFRFDGWSDNVTLAADKYF